MTTETVSSTIMPEIIATEQPANVDFAIVDLAVDGSMLAWVYEQMQHQPMLWESLYQRTEWREHWRTGPILVELRGCHHSTTQLAKTFSREPKGLFITAPETSFEVMVEHLTQQAVVEHHGKLAALRFYESRHITEFLKILTDAQLDSLVLLGSQWTWHDSESWKLYRSPQPAFERHQQVRRINLSSEQLEHFETLKRSKRAKSLAAHYRDWIPGGEPEQAVYDHLEAARRVGLDRIADQERWLRLALTLSSPVEKSKAWRELAGHDQFTPRQKLAKMEENV